MELCFFEGFQILPFLKIFITDSQNPRKLVPINMDNDWMYPAYQNRGKGFITLGVMSHGRFSKN